jgi:penicillin G amidase
VSGNRILSYINYLIALALVAVALAGYWFVYRPQAQTAGAVAAGVTAEVSIARDARGVPHITAKSIDDLFFAQGYVHAQDRLFQLDITRRQAAGELAEIFGANSLPSDLDARRLQMRRLAEAHAAKLDPDSRAAFTAYARGINHFIETHLASLPLEFNILGYGPAPWTIADSMLVALNLARALNESWPLEIAKQAMLQGGNPQLVEYLYPTRTGAEPQMGSNAWAVAGSHTSTGKPILASDPHLALSLPGVWYQNDLRAPAFHVAGVSLPGIPAVVIGHNDTIAWGMTNLQFDVQDLYIEPAGQPAISFQDAIRVRGGTVASIGVAATPRGPLIAGNAALHWTAADPGGLNFALLGLNRAANWDQFRNALRAWTAPAQNFLYADTAGNIGHQVAGLLPKRLNHAGDVPVAAADQFAWQGTIPFDDLPMAYNPPSGHVISANQNPFPANFPYRVNGNFAPPDRALQIERRLVAKAKLSLEDMQRIQFDHYSAFHHFLAQQLVAAAQDRTSADADLAEAVRLLSAWDGQMSASSAPGMIAAIAWKNLRQAIVERAAPGRSGNYDFPMATAAAERLLRERPKVFFADYNPILLRALLDAIKTGMPLQGSNLVNWRLGTYQSLTLPSLVLGNVRILGGVFAGWTRLGPEELGGASTTISQRTEKGAQIVAPSMRMVVDLANWDASVLNLATGQSGQVFSSHFTDQWNTYTRGSSFPFAFNKVETSSVLRLTPR